MAETTATDTARSAIEAAGWRTDTTPATGAKHFDSVCGPKQALIWVNNNADQVGNFSVTGEFWSEGRNILSGSGLILNVNTPTRKIPELITQFLARIEKQIRGSYAVRLLRRPEIHPESA